MLCTCFFFHSYDCCFIYCISLFFILFFFYILMFRLTSVMYFSFFSIFLHYIIYSFSTQLFFFRFLVLFRNLFFIRNPPLLHFPFYQSFLLGLKKEFGCLPFPLGVPTRPLFVFFLSIEFYYFMAKEERKIRVYGLSEILGGSLFENSGFVCLFGCVCLVFVFVWLYRILCCLVV